MARVHGGSGPQYLKKKLGYLKVHNEHALEVLQLLTNGFVKIPFSRQPSPLRPITTFQLDITRVSHNLITGKLRPLKIPYSFQRNNNPQEEHWRVIETPTGHMVYDELTPAEASVYPLEHQYGEWCRLKTLNLICQE